MEYGTIREMCKKEVLTVTETAEMLGLSRQRIYDFIKDGTYKPFRYLKYSKGKGEMPLLIRSEVLDTEKRKMEEKRDFRGNYILTSLAKKIMKKRLPDFIKDLDNGIIEEYNNVKEIQGTGGYINLKEFMDYAKNYGINLDGLITTSTVEYKLLENGISLRLNDFLKKYGIKPVYDFARDRKYALFIGKDIENAIKEELLGEKRT